MYGSGHIKTAGAKKLYLYVCPLCCRAEMYTGRVAYCSLVSQGGYADETDRRTDRRQTVTLRFPLWMRPVYNDHGFLFDRNKHVFYLFTINHCNIL